MILVLRPRYALVWKIGSMFLLIFAFLSAAASIAHTGPQFRRPQAGDPVVETILYGPSEARTWIRHNGERFHALAKTRLDNEWRVEEIRRESVLLKRNSMNTFVEMPVSLSKRPRFHKGWSLLGSPSGLWEALELLTAGFGHHVVMHHRAGATIAPCVHGTTLEQMLLKIMPRHHRFAFAGSVLLVLPVESDGESWTAILARLQQQRPEQLAAGFPGLQKPGTLLSRGNDIQFVLRQISLGGETPILFPNDLHFPVHASFRNVSFCQILTKIAYLNQCSIIIRPDRIEIAPITRALPGTNPGTAGPAVFQPDLEPSVPDSASPFPDDPSWKPLPPPPLPLELQTTAGDSE